MIVSQLVNIVYNDTSVKLNAFLPDEDQSNQQDETADIWDVMRFVLLIVIVALVLVPNLVFLCGHCYGRKNRVDLQLSAYLQQAAKLERVRPEIAPENFKVQLSDSLLDQEEARLLYLAMCCAEDDKKQIPDFALQKDVLTKHSLQYYKRGTLQRAVKQDLQDHDDPLLQRQNNNVRDSNVNVNLSNSTTQQRIVLNASHMSLASSVTDEVREHKAIMEARKHR